MESDRAFIRDLKKHIAEVRKEIAKTGIQATSAMFEKMLTSWKDVPVNIALMGNSGSGKSSLINAFRNLTADDEGGAAVDVKECTKEPKSYSHPTNKNFNLWDLPGVGTPNFPKGSKYLQNVKFERYDFFLIVSSVRFTENDSWLADQIDKEKKRFYFVRTKIDEDIENDAVDHPETSSENGVLEKVREDCKSNLESFDNPRVFLVSNFHRESWDFPELCNQMAEDVSEMKKTSMILSLDGISKKIIQAKKKVLRQRTWNVVTRSEAPAEVIPGLNIPIKISLIEQEVEFYKQQFGLSAECLKNLSVKINKDEQFLALSCNLSQLSVESIIQEVISNQNFEERMKKIAEAISDIPLITGVIVSVLSFVTTVMALQKIIDRMEDEALNVLEIVSKEISSNFYSNQQISCDMS